MPAPKPTQAELAAARAVEPHARAKGVPADKEDLKPEQLNSLIEEARGYLEKANYAGRDDELFGKALFRYERAWKEIAKKKHSGTEDEYVQGVEVIMGQVKSRFFMYRFHDAFELSTKHMGIVNSKMARDFYILRIAAALCMDDYKAAIKEYKQMALTSKADVAAFWQALGGTVHQLLLPEQNLLARICFEIAATLDPNATSTQLLAVYSKAPMNSSDVTVSDLIQFRADVLNIEARHVVATGDQKATPPVPLGSGSPLLSTSDRKDAKTSSGDVKDMKSDVSTVPTLTKK